MTLSLKSLNLKNPTKNLTPPQTLTSLRSIKNQRNYYEFHNEPNLEGRAKNRLRDQRPRQKDYRFEHWLQEKNEVRDVIKQHDGENPRSLQS